MDRRQRTFTLVPHHNNARPNSDAPPPNDDSRILTSKQLEKIYRQTKRTKRLSRAEQALQDRREQERIRRELAEESRREADAARKRRKAQVAKAKQLAREEAVRAERRSLGVPLVECHASQDTLTRFFRGRGDGSGGRNGVGKGKDLENIPEEVEGEREEEGPEENPRPSGRQTLDGHGAHGAHVVHHYGVEESGGQIAPEILLPVVGSGTVAGNVQHDAQQQRTPATPRPQTPIVDAGQLVDDLFAEDPFADDPFADDPFADDDFFLNDDDGEIASAAMEHEGNPPPGLAPLEARSRTPIPSPTAGAVAPQSGDGHVHPALRLSTPVPAPAVADTTTFLDDPSFLADFFSQAEQLNKTPTPPAPAPAKSAGRVRFDLMDLEPQKSPHRAVCEEPPEDPAIGHLTGPFLESVSLESPRRGSVPCSPRLVPPSPEPAPALPQSTQAFLLENIDDFSHLSQESIGFSQSQGERHNGGAHEGASAVATAFSKPQHPELQPVSPPTPLDAESFPFLMTQDLVFTDDDLAEINHSPSGQQVPSLSFSSSASPSPPSSKRSLRIPPPATNDDTNTEIAPVQDQGHAPQNPAAENDPSPRRFFTASGETATLSAAMARSRRTANLEDLSRRDAERREAGLRLAEARRVAPAPLAPSQGYHGRKRMLECLESDGGGGGGGGGDSARTAKLPRHDALPPASSQETDYGDLDLDEDDFETLTAESGTPLRAAAGG